MATVVIQQQVLEHAAPPSPLNPALTLNRSSSPVPNKHIPVCSTGPSPCETPELSSHPRIWPDTRCDVTQTSSLLYPPDRFDRISSVLPVYSVDATVLHDALDHLASQPLPDAELMFPWLHGLHPDNRLQKAFFLQRKRSLRYAPRCWRGITLVKVGGNLRTAKLKGAVAVDEILAPSGTDFVQADPPEGFSIRNFQIQTAKLAAMSDIVLYGDHSVGLRDLLSTAEKIAIAQQSSRLTYKSDNDEKPLFNTFIVSSVFEEIEARYPQLVAIDSKGRATGNVIDFFRCERSEMCTMSKASQISNNVWQGPTPEHTEGCQIEASEKGEKYDLLIQASELGSIPTDPQLTCLEKRLGNGPQCIDFPSSGSVVWTGNNPEVDNFVNTVRWLYYLANPVEPSSEEDADGDMSMVSLSKKARKILIHCVDGYTESSLLVLAYSMFAEGLTAPEAWLKLHCQKKRNFFAYPADVTFLSSVQGYLLQESPMIRSLPASRLPDPAWFRGIDGSFPSRILPYMYLGNLSHANNPDLLSALGIRRVLSIGESVSWSVGQVRKFGVENLLYIGKVQDNGIDPLMQELDKCLSFIRRGKRDETATLVHCRVGVSRSATICIAEVMTSLGLSFPRSYCFVRARRLNVIIQPHLRFVYELLKWEEVLQQQQNKPLKRELEWPTIAREIALMNKPYYS